jgi:hypothetical protein
VRNAPLLICNSPFLKALKLIKIETAVGLRLNCKRDTLGSLRGILKEPKHMSTKSDKGVGNS